MHYSRWHKYGDPTIVHTVADMIVPLRKRFDAAVSKGSSCWQWLGATTRSGYGRIKERERPIVAHRLAWEYANGPIPTGMLVCHSCDNPGCVNPAHLFLGTQSENMRDMVAKGRRTPIVKRITDEQAAAIRSSTDPTRIIAERFGISVSHVWGIKTRRSH